MDGWGGGRVYRGEHGWGGFWAVGVGKGGFDEDLVSRVFVVFGVAARLDFVKKWQKLIFNIICGLGIRDGDLVDTGTCRISITGAS